MAIASSALADRSRIAPRVSPLGMRLRIDVLSEPILCGNGVAISRGKDEDVSSFASIVSKEIATKSNITAEEIFARCSTGATFIAAKRGSEVIGGTIVVYEKEDAYLWLGAYSEKGNGIGSLSAKLALKEAFALGYRSISAKTSEGNAVALSLLRKLGFEIREKCNGVVKLWRKLELNMAKNTLPWTPACVQEAVASLAHMQCCEYHDKEKEVKERIASSLGTSPKNIRLSANGSDSIRLVLSLTKGSSIAVLYPTYPPIVECSHEAGVVFPLYEKDVLEGKVDWLEGKTVVLCNQNNPTGTLVPQEIIRQIARIAKLLIIDEAYMHFAGKGAESLVEDFPVVVLRTITKLGSAVAQLGILVGKERLISLLPPWSEPSSAGMHVACSIFTPDGMGEIADISREIARQRKRMEDDLAGIWMPLRQSWANFVLFEERNLETDKLKEKGIIAKRFVIGGKKYFRITVRSDWEIDLLLLAAREISSGSV